MVDIRLARSADSGFSPISISLSVPFPPHTTNGTKTPRSATHPNLSKLHWPRITVIRTAQDRSSFCMATKSSRLNSQISATSSTRRAVLVERSRNRQRQGSARRRPVKTEGQSYGQALHLGRPSSTFERLINSLMGRRLSASQEKRRFL